MFSKKRNNSFVKIYVFAFCFGLISKFVFAVDIDYQKDIKIYQELVNKNNQNLKAFDNLGKTFELSGKSKDAFKTYEKAMSVNPNFIEARFYEGEPLKRFDPSTLALPEKCIKWEGQNLDGKKILVFSEKGLGDTIQWCRFLPMLASKSEKVYFKTQNPLISFLKTLDLRADILDSSFDLSKIDADFYVSLLSLPYLLDLNLDQIPFYNGYLKSDPEKTFKFKKKYFDNNDLKIGIVWQGDPNHVNDKNRSIKLSCFYDLVRLKGVKFYSFQKGFGIEQLKNLPKDINIVDLNDEIKDFSDTAALIENLDILIGVDTALIHFSAALNKKTWMLTPYTTDWRWFGYSQSDDKNYWYASLKKVRQAQEGNWDDVFNKIMFKIKNEIKLRIK